MRKAQLLLVTALPVLLALAVAILASRMWLQGAEVFGGTLPPPQNVEEWTKVLSFTFGIPAGVLALFTYVRAAFEQQRSNLWKRREYLAARFDRLEGLANCKAAMRMLDYNATYLDLDGLRGQVVSDRLVMSALAPHQMRGAYTPQEQIIREAFDAFFSELDRLGAMAAAGLVEPKDLEPYADYWLGLFKPGERSRPAAYDAILRRYVRVFHFKALGKLLQDRELMISAGPDAATQAADDDALISAFDASWTAPEALEWDERVKRVEASS